MCQSHFVTHASFITMFVLLLQPFEHSCVLFEHDRLTTFIVMLVLLLLYFNYSCVQFCGMTVFYISTSFLSMR